MYNRKLVLAGLLCVFVPALTQASENLPEKAFGDITSMPEQHQLTITPWYNYSRFSFFWRGTESVSIRRGHDDDFEVNDGMIHAEFGLTHNLALDTTLGYTSAASRFTDPGDQPRTTQGLMDVPFGVRYRFLDESNSVWQPTLIARAGWIFQGSYTPNFPFAPGRGGMGPDLSLEFNKNILDSGFGLDGNIGWRDRNHGVPQQVYGGAGIHQTIHLNRWLDTMTFSFGYRHLQDLSGTDIPSSLTVGSGIPPGTDFRGVKEVSQRLEWGAGANDTKGRHYQFFMQKNLYGRNTGDNLVYGLYVTFPLGGK